MSSPAASLNRAAIVTGAAQGIGRAIALRLAQDGYDLAVNDLPSNNEALNLVAEEIRAVGRKAITVFGDVSKEQDVQTLVDRTVDELGMLYVMVSNAGIAPAGAEVTDMSLELWNLYLSVNLTGTFLCYKAAAKQMVKQGRGGRIIGASSIYGKQAAPVFSAYSVSKFGVRGLTQAMSSELATKGITVNAYAPGFIDTPLMEDADKMYSARTGSAPGTLTEMAKKRSPMGRYGKPEEVSALVSYIVSDGAEFLTGQSLSLNGGMFFD